MKEELEKLLKEGYVSTGISYADSEIYKKDNERVVYNIGEDKRVFSYQNEVNLEETKNEHR